MMNTNSNVISFACNIHKAFSPSIVYFCRTIVILHIQCNSYPTPPLFCVCVGSVSFEQYIAFQHLQTLRLAMKNYPSGCNNLRVPSLNPKEDIRLGNVDS